MTFVKMDLSWKSYKDFLFYILHVNLFIFDNLTFENRFLYLKMYTEQDRWSHVIWLCKWQVAEYDDPEVTLSGRWFMAW